MASFNTDKLDEFLRIVKPHMTDDEFNNLITKIVWKIMFETEGQVGQ